jgi:serine/threonine protein kinase
MASNPQVLGLLEEMLDSGRTPEEVCCDCPELLPEVRQRWQEFCLIDEQVGALLPGLRTVQQPGPTAAVPPTAGLPQVPGYEVEAVLGCGGMGIVYRARHLALKRTVALKMLAAGTGSRPAERARFRAEAEAVARLQHPNIVAIHEVGEVDGRPFIALEYVAGGSLAERLARQLLPPRDAARLVAALAEAMHLAHSRNLVHRDLKPANVLLAGAADTPLGQCQPKVTDFGLVRQLDAEGGQTFDGLVMGTPSYMAPEQAEGRARSAGPAADVYALGAILYECLTGRPPFQGATPLAILEQVRSREPVANLDRPGDVRIADALLAVLDDPNVQPTNYLLFEMIAPRLDKRDLRRLLEHPLAAGRLQEPLLPKTPGTTSTLPEANGNGTDGLSLGTVESLVTNACFVAASFLVKNLGPGQGNDRAAATRPAPLSRRSTARSRKASRRRTSWTPPRC